MEKENRKCPHCGAILVLSEKEDHYVCQYCDSIFPFVGQPFPSTAPFYDEIVALVCDSGCDMNEETYTGVSLKDLEFFPTAKKHFQIPDEEDCCMLHNCSIIRLFTTGFALCSTGLYYRIVKNKTGKLSYSQLKNCEFASIDGDFYIDDLCFISFSDRGSVYRTLFRAIQKRIPSDIT